MTDQEFNALEARVNAVMAYGMSLTEALSMFVGDECTADIAELQLFACDKWTLEFTARYSGVYPTRQAVKAREWTDEDHDEYDFDLRCGLLSHEEA